LRRTGFLAYKSNFAIKQASASAQPPNGFAPETVERLRKLIWEQKKPKRILQVPVDEIAKIIEESKND